MSGEGLSTLAPHGFETWQSHKNITGVLNKIVRQIALQHLGQDLLLM